MQRSSNEDWAVVAEEVDAEVSTWGKVEKIYCIFRS